MDTKHWILQIPIFKAFSITIFIVHLIGIPLFYSFIEYRDFFDKTDFLKLIFFTTSIGSIFSTILIILSYLIYLAGEKSTINDKGDDFAVIVISVFVIGSFCLADFYLVFGFLFNQRIIQSLAYSIIAISPLVILVLMLVGKRLLKGKSRGK